MSDQLSVFLLTIRGTLSPATLEAARKVHNQTAGDPAGVAAAHKFILAGLGNRSMKFFGETILVADDDPYIQEALKDRLESLGCRVLQAADGLKAVEIIERQTPHMAFQCPEMP